MKNMLKCSNLEVVYTDWGYHGVQFFSEDNLLAPIYCRCLINEWVWSDLQAYLGLFNG